MKIIIEALILISFTIVLLILFSISKNYDFEKIFKNELKMIPIEVNETKAVPIEVNETKAVPIEVNETKAVPIEVNETKVVPIEIDNLNKEIIKKEKELKRIKGLSKTEQKKLSFEEIIEEDEYNIEKTPEDELAEFLGVEKDGLNELRRFVGEKPRYRKKKTFKMEIIDKKGPPLKDEEINSNSEEDLHTYEEL